MSPEEQQLLLTQMPTQTLVRELLHRKVLVPVQVRQSVSKPQLETAFPGPEAVIDYAYHGMAHVLARAVELGATLDNGQTVETSRKTQTPGDDATVLLELDCVLLDARAIPQVL